MHLIVRKDKNQQQLTTVQEMIGLLGIDDWEGGAKATINKYL